MQGLRILHKIHKDWCFVILTERFNLLTYFEKREFSHSLHVPGGALSHIIPFLFLEEAATTAFRSGSVLHHPSAIKTSLFCLCRKGVNYDLYIQIVHFANLLLFWHTLYFSTHCAWLWFPMCYVWHELSSMLVGICAKLQSFKHSCWTFASFYYWLHAENDSSRQSTYHNLSLIHTFLY